MVVIWQEHLSPWTIIGTAYGLTMFESDLIYQEENSPSNANKYKTPTGFSNI
jgi:hypothetical protein